MINKPKKGLKFGGNQVRCPSCKFENSKVIESRSADEGCKVRRRRECESCSKRFTTYEEIEKTPLIVIKRSGAREKYDRNKVFNGLLKACEKRAISIEQIEQMTDSIETEVQNSLDREIGSIKIGEFSMNALKVVDEIAYIRFASVYRKFKDVKDFMNELKKLLNNPSTPL